MLIRVRTTTEIPAHGPAIVVGLPPATSAPNDRRYPIAVIGRGYHGLLTSSLTRVPGLVSIADVARTALQTPHALEHAGVTAAPSRPRTASRIRSTSRAARRWPARCSCSSLLVMFALFYPRGSPTALGTAIAVNLALGWFPAGDAAPRVTLLGLSTVAGGLLGPMLLRRRTQLGARAHRAPRRVRGLDARATVDAVARTDRARADEPLLRRLEPARDVAPLPRARSAPRSSRAASARSRSSPSARSRSRRSPRTSSARTAAARSSSASRSPCSPWS